jgi:hypothetical protein
VFGPLLEKLPEGYEVKDAGVYIDECIGAIIIIDEMIDFPNNKLLTILPEPRLIPTGSKKEEVRCRLLTMLEQLQLSNMTVLFSQDSFHPLVKERVVIVQKYLVTCMVVH